MTSPSPVPLARVYVAAPCGEAHVANMLRALLRAAGFHVVSQWTDRLRKQSAVPSRAELTGIHRANSAELDDADLVVAWTAAGTPRATYGEIGYALAKGKPVLWLQGPNGEGSNSYDTEPLVRVLAVDLATTYLARDAAIVTAAREMAEEQRERAERLEALARVATPGAPQWGEPADSGAPGQPSAGLPCAARGAVPRAVHPPCRQGGCVKFSPTLGALIRSARESAGYTLRDLAEILGVSHVYVSEVERRIRKLAVGRWSAVCDALPSLTVRDLAVATVAHADRGNVMVNVTGATDAEIDAVTVLLVRAAKGAA